MIWNYDIAVIGGGAAGCMAAGQAAACGKQVVLIEKNTRIARKVGITGKGRCNVTNHTELQSLIQNIPQGGKFLYGALSRFSSADCMAFFESLGVPLKTERGARVFPVSDQAFDIVDALDRFLKQNRVSRLTGEAAEILTENNCVCGVRLKDGKQIHAKAVILATGGLSYPGTGSTGDGYRMAAALGHTVTPLIPSLVPLLIQEKDCPQMQGLSLKNITLTVLDTKTNTVIYSQLGEMLFTHFGVSGPLVLSASAHMRPMEPSRYRLQIDLKPALSKEQLDARVLRDFSDHLNSDLLHALGALLPRKSIPCIIQRSGIDCHTKVHQITRVMRSALVESMKNFSLTVTGFAPIAQAVITSGGISLKEVDPKTMASKRVPGLYFAGEILDVDAYTGGFNLQIAWSTGYTAGKAAAEASP